ncbi:disease resistance protein RGA2-like [Coffea arabica]|uniref:Disease resistance protein RGA2-like n=1 Tax=Coffea arabica TaxID=13443 RepID=A0A6P6THE8_COFAR|nr:putative disease resistance protein RGA3 [Coffea arabica]XP_027077462.1 putative disease resistance protein RGA3 [Coffea arabica]XP_027077530.1 putative disease resistance protein RGA3 [Coffea arabica]XP_027077605.1 putative disease resistance protein RGA3 [Coffea arabica]XP_027077685.1 putative disease resistance protein RGA3 [Coffea arabica]XP_027077759.1 putative disease resistance protein RGA3 [Coffea arabica]XP_027077833.1 putative disease resistance protein RGA3 [Coffea arabica]XP_0
MSDALISSTIQVTLERALSLASDRIGLLVGFKKDVASMTLSLGFIKDVLVDAEGRQNQSSGVQRWLRCLDEVAYDAQNVLDELHYESLRHQVESRNRHKLKVCCFFSFCNINLAFRWRMASKVRDIKFKLNEINQEANRLGLVSRLVMTAALPAAVGDTRSRQTDSVVAPMIGRTDDESKIVKMLLSPSEKVVSCLPITGMGGLGKTTLAKSIYNNKQIDAHFNKKIWVCVSKKVPIEELFKLILVHLTKEKVEVDVRDVIVEKIQNQLGGKRYLLVLDDVWDDNQALWDDFFTTLKGLNPTNGSWCLVTTRLGPVAHSVSRVLRMMENEPYPLGKLPDDHCWSIVKEKVVGGEEELDELKAIKKRVIKRCDGLPLAASVIGGLLSLKRKEEWQSILENRLLSWSAGGDHVKEILEFSFDNLPSPYIKKCFAYCSIFPKDIEMKGDMLIELWMAEGFLQVDINSQMMMEEIGMNYLRILLQSSLFEERIYQSITYYVMHDLVHDLAGSMSKSTKVINNGDTHIVDSGNQIRYLAIDSSGGREDREKLLESLSTSIHTLFIVNGDLSGDMLMKLKNLYVLSLSRATTQELPVSIGKLIHLRYFNIEFSAISILPNCICKLYKLQTLTLTKAVKDLPKGMCNLISLRHLYYYNDDEEFQMPLGMGRLTCLQTLEFFKVGLEKGRRIGVLGSLKNLKGKLSIHNLHLVNDKEGAEEANLSEKANLFSFRLVWAWPWYREDDNHNDKDVLDGLRPHPNLKELVIENFMGEQFPRWLMELPTATTLPKSATTLPKLARLKFKCCNRCRELHPLQNFTSLKELVIKICYGLTNLPGVMLHSCTSLQKLRVIGCNNLISFPLDLQQTPSLLKLELFKCPKLKTSMTPKGFGFLTGLRQLTIGPFSDDDDDHENSSLYNEFDWSGLISSSSSSSSAPCQLRLYGLPHMESLPHQIQYLTTLTTLTLDGFGGIKALPDWFGNLAALEDLYLRNFKELRQLPSEDAMRSLTKLKRLWVLHSPLLKERCTPESSGPDSQWSKVSHIQDLDIIHF